MASAAGVTHVAVQDYGTAATSTVAITTTAKPAAADAAEKQAAVEKALWWWNFTCMCAHLVQAIIALALGEGSSKIAEFRLPLMTSFLTWECVENIGKGVWNDLPRTELLTRGMLPFCSVTSGFAWMSAAAHGIVLLFFHSHYIPDLRRGINRFRWFEYAASSSLMIGLIAMLFGMYDVISLVLVMSVNACMNLFGYMMELHNQTTKETDWTAFWFGCFAGVVPWAVTFAYLGGSPAVGEVPGFVWAILIVYLVAFNTFPLNMWLQYSKTGWFSDEYWGWKGAGYMFGERAYQIQSLASKSILLWLVIGGTNQPNSYTE